MVVRKEKCWNWMRWVGVIEHHLDVKKMMVGIEKEAVSTCSRARKVIQVDREEGDESDSRKTLEFALSQLSLSLPRNALIGTANSPKAFSMWEKVKGKSNQKKYHPASKLQEPLLLQS